MDLFIVLIAFAAALATGVFLPRLMRSRPRWMGFAAFLILLFGIILGVILGFPGNPAGIALFVFGLFCALTAWTVAAPRLTSVTIWSFFASMLSTSALLLLFPGDIRTVGIGVALAISIVWVTFQFWCYWDKRAWRVATGLILVSVVSGIAVYTIPPPT